MIIDHFSKDYMTQLFRNLDIYLELTVILGIEVVMSDSSRPLNYSTPGLPIHHQLPEVTQTQVHRVSDAIQPSHPLSSPSPLAPNPSQHQSLFR